MKNSFHFLRKKYSTLIFTALYRVIIPIQRMTFSDWNRFTFRCVLKIMFILPFYLVQVQHTWTFPTTTTRTCFFRELNLRGYSAENVTNRRSFSRSPVSNLGHTEETVCNYAIRNGYRWRFPEGLSVCSFFHSKPHSYCNFNDFPSFYQFILRFTKRIDAIKNWNIFQEQKKFSVQK